MEETGIPHGEDAARGAASLRIDRGRPQRRSGSAGAWILGILVVAAAAGIAWRLYGKATGALGGRAVREGRAVRVSPESGAELTTASGYVVARTRAAISPKYPGKLVRLLVDVGDVVEKDQLLAELDHVELDAALDRWRSEVDRARSDLEASVRTVAERKSAADWSRSAAESARTALRESEVRRDDARREADRLQRLLAEKVVTESERDRAVAQAAMGEAQAAGARAALASAEVEAIRAGKEALTMEARVEASKAGLASAEAAAREGAARREDSFIRATFRGRVLRKEAEVGEVIAPAATGGGSTRGALLTLADFDTLEMEVDVIERDVSRVKEGSPSRIVLDAYPRDPFAGKVRQVVPTADRQKATVQVKVAFDRPDSRVIPEMGGKVVFLAEGTRVSGEAERVFVPAAALREREGRSGVWLLEREGSGTRVRFLPVGAGAREGDRAVALSGLTGGERVVLDPPGDLKDGELVTLQGDGGN